MNFKKITISCAILAALLSISIGLLTTRFFTEDLKANIVLLSRMSGGAVEYILRPAAAGIIFIAITGSGYEMLITPSPSESLHFNGVDLSVDEGVENTTLVLGQRIVFYTKRLNGAYRWMCYSADAGWVEETP